MRDVSAECLVYRAEELLPEAWRYFSADGPVRVFNPGLLRDGESWLFAYRVVGPDGLRRIGLCRLDATLRVVAGTQLPLSDSFRFRDKTKYPEVVRHWFADPRLYRFGNRVLIYWNSGWHEPRNHQFVHELDPLSLQPLGAARELMLREGRQKLEKNWTLFRIGSDRADEAHAVYSILPHRVLTFSLAGEADVVFEPAAQVEWSLEGYPRCHGGLRGGAPPVFSEGRFWSFCHSVHDAANGYRYAAAVYAFEAESPFRPVAAPLHPLELAREWGERRAHARLNPVVGNVIYPCGAARDGARWLVSHGINDELCALSAIEHSDLAKTVHEVKSAETRL